MRFATMLEYDSYTRFIIIFRHEYDYTFSILTFYYILYSHYRTVEVRQKHSDFNRWMFLIYQVSKLI
jgi:hypothetical protein